MPQHCATTGKVIPSYIALMSTANVTIGEPEETWFPVARRYFSSSVFGAREEKILRACRQLIQEDREFRQEEGIAVGKIVPRHVTYT